MRKIVDLIVKPMNLLGLNPLKRDTFFGCYVRVLLCVVALIYGMHGTILFTYHANNDFYNFVVPVAYSIGLFSISVVILAVQKYKPRIRNVLSTIDDNVFTYPDEDDFRPDYEPYLCEENYFKVCALVLSLQIIGFMMALLSPFIGYVLVGSLRFYPYPQWTLWNVDSTYKYLLTYSLQLFVLGIAFVYFATIHLYFTFVLVEFLRQYKKLQYAVETLNRRSLERMILTNVDKPSIDTANERQHFDNVFKFNLIGCICHHQKLYELFRTFKILYEIVYSLELTIFTFSFFLELYCLVEEHDQARRLTLIGAVWEMIGNLFFKCLIGEEFSEMNSRIQHSLFYETQWYDHSLENRKLISILHLATKTPNNLKGFGTFESSYYVFSRIIRSSYSYFNLIRAS